MERKLANHGNEGSASKFRELLDWCIKDTMKNILGESGMQAVMYHAGFTDVANRLHEFHDGLSAVLKEKGAIILEKTIVKQLFRSLNIPYVEGHRFDFHEHVRMAEELASTRMGSIHNFD